MSLPSLATADGDHRHLQRRDEQPALADRHAADVDAVARRRRRSARRRGTRTPRDARSLGGRSTSARLRRSRSAPCTRCIVSLPSFSADLGPDRVDRVRQRRRERDRRRSPGRRSCSAARPRSSSATCRRPATVLACTRPLSIAAAAVTTLNVEPGGYWPCVVRLTAPSPLLQRRGVARVAQLVGVERRVARHDADLRRSRLERDDRAALPAERLERRALRARVERRAQLVALRLACRASWSTIDVEVVVARRSARRCATARAPTRPTRQERVADRVREQVARRVAARVRAAAAAAPSAASSVPSRARIGAALDALLLEQRALVERVVAQLLGLEHRPARRPRDERARTAR